MNANQIVNMVLRIIMRKAIGKGIDAGIKGATNVTRGRGQQRGAPSPRQVPQDDFAPDFQNEGAPTQDEIRRQRQAKRAARQARQAAKVTGKIGRM